MCLRISLSGMLNFYNITFNFLIILGIKKNCFSNRNPLLRVCLFTRRVMELTVVIIRAHHCYQLRTEAYEVLFFQG